VHTQNFSPNGALTRIFPRFLTHVAAHRDSVWLARATQVSDWWRIRANLRVRYTLLSGTRIEVNVSNLGAETAENVALVMTLPRPGSRPKVVAINTNAPRLTEKTLDPFRTALVMSRLPKGHYAYYIDY
jgi:hypothetical protein